jgi:HEAT repeat protein
VAAGPVLARAAATGEAELRVEALRAVAQIQPPESAAVFRAGLHDADPDVRKLASAGLILVAELPDEVVPELIESLHDPEARVRSNAARVLLRIDPLPPAAVTALKDCTHDADAGMRLNAARVLRNATPDEVKEEFIRLLEDDNPRLRLLAASSLLAADPADGPAAAVVVAALRLGPPGIRRDAIELIASLGPNGQPFRGALADQAAEEVEPELNGRIGEVLEKLEEPAEPLAG